jgi:predicted RNA polymerase sigma factor
LTRDLGSAEDLAQDALVAALEHWPRTGVPGAAGRLAHDHGEAPGARPAATRKMLDRKHEQLGRELDERPDTRADELDARSTMNTATICCGLMFVTCHPVLSSDARVALTLRLLGGLTADEIARAFLAPEPTIEQRIVRAKRTLAEARVPFEAPRGAERAARLASVLEVIYLVFNEGYAATRGDDWLRPALCEDALRLGRVLAELAPAEPEVHGLVALMELPVVARARARRTARRAGAAARPGPRALGPAADRARARRTRARRGAGRRARRVRAPGGDRGLSRPGAGRGRDRVDAHRGALRRTRCARSLAGGGAEPRRGRGDGIRPAAGLELVDALAQERSLADYHLLPAARGDLLDKLGRFDEARAEFARAASLTRNAREQKVLLDRAAACGRPR